MIVKSDKKTKVALVAPSLPVIGGQSIQARSLFDAFQNDDKNELTFIPNNPKNFGQKIRFVRTLTTSLTFWVSLFRMLRNVDIVHIFSSGTTSYVISTLPPLLIAKFYGKKTILHYHTGEAETHLKNWRKSVQTMRYFDRIIVPSQFLVEVFARFSLQTNAISNFVETEKFRFQKRESLRPIFLSNRNFEPHYQVADVLRAFSLIQKKICNAHLMLIGSGHQEADLKKLAAELQLKNVEFVGRVEPNMMPEYYNKSDIYLNSSIVDNMPLSIIEAFCCGLPVVTTNAGGIPYIVEHERNGLVVNVNDYSALADAATRLLENNELAQKLIAEAHHDGVKCSWSQVRAHWVRSYEELASE